MRATLLISAVILSACGPDLSAEDPDDLELGTAELATPRAPAKGLMSRTFTPRSPGPAFSALMHDTVVQVSWTDLEASGAGTTSGGYYAAGTHGWSVLESALAQGYAVRLRIKAGGEAPAYVKRIGFTRGVGSSAALCPDGGVYVYNRQDARGVCVPKFWDPSVIARYDALMQEVSRRFGAAPGLREVVDAACMTTYAEPFYRAHGDTGSNQRLLDAGLTAGKDLYCHQRAIGIHNRWFPSVRTSLAVNGWDLVTPDTANRVRMGFQPTYDFLEGTGSAAFRMTSSGTPTTTRWPGARTVLGRRLVLQNNGLGEHDVCTAPTSANVQTDHFCYLSRVAQAGVHSVGFQTETMARLREDATGAIVRTEEEGVRLAIANALTMHAAFVEMPSGFEDWTSTTGVALLRRSDAALEANSP
ncbi:MAG: hypothetical protein K1X89_30670 [Myxococcaceae bacterium]|nr:hypothetical protein [Myxococcaceae bacterium]